MNSKNDGAGRRSVRWLLAAACTWPMLASAASQADVQQVEVSARTPDVEEHDYADMLDAVTRFLPYHQAHPDAVLRFRIRQRKEMAGVDMAQLVVYVVDPARGVRVPIAVAADGGFTLPSLPDQRGHDAKVRTNMPPGSLTWYAQVTREGADPRDRVLGDIRMECTLDVYAADLRRKFKPPAYYAMRLAMTDICRNDPLVHWDAYSEKPLFAVHLRSGTREKSLNEVESLHAGMAAPLLYPTQDWSYLLMDFTYWPPVGDSSWPDDTAIHLVYVEDRPAPAGGAQ